MHMANGGVTCTWKGSAHQGSCTPGLQRVDEAQMSRCTCGSKPSAVTASSGDHVCKLRSRGGGSPPRTGQQIGHACSGVTLSVVFDHFVCCTLIAC